MAAQNPIQLGIAHQQAGRLAEARAIYEQVLAREPRHADALHLLGIISVQEGNFESGIDLITRAIEIAQHVVEYRLSLINVCLDAGRTVEAIEHCKQAIEVARIRSLPRFTADLGDILLQIGNAFLQSGDRVHGMDALAAAASIRPPIAAAFNDFGAALRDIGRLDESIEILRDGLKVAPAISEIHNNLGNTLKDQGRPDEAIAAFREAIRLQPANATAHQNLLFAMHLSPSTSAEAIAAEHRAWGERHADPLTRAARPHAKASCCDRLRIGYVSPDFRDHPVGRFLLPALSHHDHDAFDAVCYSNWHGPADAMTQRFASCASAWRNVARMNDEQLAEQIRADGIHILVDVAGHSVSNRLGVFARKPAPVQITWLGYPDTTGMSAMDWRITDAHADPPGMTEALHVEKLIRMPTTAWCLEPPADAPRTARDTHDGITFGSFNSLSKLNNDLLRIWAKLLEQTPGASMLIKGVGLAGEQTRGRLLNTFAACGIDPSRIELLTPTKSYADHLALYRRVDVALDAYPYHGTTTTCEALWMGVPVVTLAGRTHVSRVGVSLLSNAGLGEMVATTPEQYVSIASELARDVIKRNELRSTLRDRLRASPITDARKFACEIEDAYRFAWAEAVR